MENYTKYVTEFNKYRYMPQDECQFRFNVMLGNLYMAYRTLEMDRKYACDRDAATNESKVLLDSLRRMYHNEAYYGNSLRTYVDYSKTGKTAIASGIPILGLEYYSHGAWHQLEEEDWYNELSSGSGYRHVVPGKLDDSVTHVIYRKPYYLFDGKGYRRIDVPDEFYFGFDTLKPVKYRQDFPKKLQR